MPKQDKKSAREYIERKKVLLDKRGNFLTLWDSCARHILPDRAEFLSKQTVGNENVTIFETSAIDANYILAGWIWSQMTSPSIRWFKTGVRNKSKKEMWAVKRWFEETDDIMYSTFSQSNFYDSMSSFYLSLGAIGTDPIYMRSKIAPTYRQYFKEYSIRDCMIAENEFNVIDTIYRTIQYTVRQMLLEFGEKNLSKETKQLVSEKKWDKEIECLHVTEPRKDFDRSSDLATEMPFKSVYLEVKSEHVLQEGGYRVFPHVVGRFYRWADSPYGRSPGMLALPDIRTADSQDETNLRAGHKSAEPALNVPADMKGRVRTTPNALNYMGKSGETISPVNSGSGLPFGLEMQTERIRKINSKFFKDIIMMLDSSGSTYKNIPEIMAREQEKMSVIGAPIGRLMNQVLGPIIEWSFMDHLENGMFPPIPDELDGEDLDIEYISPLAMTLKRVEGNNLASAMELSAGVLSIDPSAAINIDADKTVRENYKIFGAERVLRSPEEVKAIKDQQAAAAADQKAMVEAQAGIESVKTLAEADKASEGKLSENLGA